jgi:ferredoxin
MDPSPYVGGYMKPQVIDRQDFGALINWLASAGYTVVGPTVHERTIILDEIDSVDDLPIGLTTQQDAAEYRLVERDDQALFGYAVGPQSWKKYLFLPKELLWHADVVDGSLRFVENKPDPPKYAFFGVRACDLAAIAIQDTVFTSTDHVDPFYAQARDRVFAVGLNCMVAGGTCFCVSMGTGPKCTTGFDLVLTEMIDTKGHKFLIESATETGTAVLAELPTSDASESDIALADAIVSDTAAAMGRSMDNSDVKELLARSWEHPRWEVVAKRCLACTNCTLVCPTCFCSTTEDATDLASGQASKTRRWDSCFSLDFTALHGRPVRESTSARYRQWMTHKLSTWYDQFGSSGCVGCGRCITWCPVGIDITEEVAAIRGTSKEA